MNTTAYDISKIKDHKAFQSAVDTYGKELMQRQYELERWAGEYGEDKFVRNTERMMANGHFHENSGGRRVISALFEPYRDAIKHNLEYQGRGARAAWKNLLDGSGHLDASDIAMISLNTIFSMITRAGKPCEQQMLARKIMDNIKTEILSREFEKTDYMGMSHASTSWNTKQVGIEKIKQDVRAKLAKREALVEPAGYEKSANVVAAGLALIHILAQHCPDTIDISEPKHIARTRREITITIHPELSQKISEGIMRLGADMFASVPLLVPPMQWSRDNLTMGGYYTSYVRNQTLIKKSRKLYSIEVQNTRGIDNVTSAVNAMQNTGWKINKKVLAAFEFLFNHTEELIPDFVRANPTPLPQWEPEYFEANKQECMRTLAKAHEEHRAERSGRLQNLTLLEMANKYKDEEAFWFCWDLDSRGRAYPITSSLSPQGSDWNKHLMHFAKGQVIEKDSDMDGVRFACATSMGHDKLPVAERIQWTKDNIEELVNVGQDPQGNLLWTDADEPAGFLAACVELAEYAEQGIGFVSRMPIAVDATCSGLQVLSALSRDEVGGTMVNLTDDAERYDIYAEVAEGPFRRKLEECAKGNLGDYADMENAQKFAAAALEYGFDRKLVKRVVMTVPYAAKQDSCRRYVNDYYHDRLKKEGSPVDEGFGRFTIFIAKVLWDSIPEVVVRGLEIMKWLQDVSCAAIKANPNSPLQWETPDGFIGRTNRPKEQLVQPSLYIYDYQRRRGTDAVEKISKDRKTIKLTTRQWLDQEDVRQHRNSCAPNFVHSLDANHLRAVVRRWSKIVSLRGQSPEFAMIHDSFAVGTRDFREFSTVIREEFVKMYEQVDPLQEYETAMREIAGPDVVFPPVPPRGSLDLSRCLKSEFFFS